jgi:hypothetical protein
MMIETLESRQFFSATPLATATVVPATPVTGGSQQRLIVVVGQNDPMNQTKPNIVVTIIAILIGL